MIYTIGLDFFSLLPFRSSMVCSLFSTLSAVYIAILDSIVDFSLTRDALFLYLSNKAFHNNISAPKIGKNMIHPLQHICFSLNLLGTIRLKNMFFCRSGSIAINNLILHFSPPQSLICWRYQEYVISDTIT